MDNNNIIVERQINIFKDCEIGRTTEVGHRVGDK